MKIFINLMFLALVVSCSSAGSTTEPTFKGQYVLPQSKNRFSKLELDDAFRQQFLFNLRLIEKRDGLKSCCVLFIQDIVALEKVFKHLDEVHGTEIERYGIIVQYDDDNYIITLTERFTEEGQFQVGDVWHPGIVAPGLQEFEYVVDRATQEIVSSTKLP